MFHNNWNKRWRIEEDKKHNKSKRIRKMSLDITYIWVSLALKEKNTYWLRLSMFEDHQTLRDIVPLKSQYTQVISPQNIERGRWWWWSSLCHVGLPYLISTTIARPTKWEGERMMREWGKGVANGGVRVVAPGCSPMQFQNFPLNKIAKTFLKTWQWYIT